MDQLKINDFWRIEEEKCPELFLHLELGQEMKEYFTEMDNCIGNWDFDEIKSLKKTNNNLQEEIVELERVIEDVKDAVRYV